MRRLIYLAISIFITLLPNERAVANTQFGMHLVAPIIDDGVYALDILYDETLTSQVHISCIDKCISVISFSEKVGYSLLGAFGNGDTYITLWSSGSVNWIIIYRIHGGIVTKVLQQPSRTLPDFEATRDGRRVIVLHSDTPGMYIGKELYGNPPGLTKADRIKIRRETTSLWLWNGTTYVPYHGDVVGGWDTIK